MLNDQVALRKSAEFPWGTMAWIILGVCLEGGGGSFVFHDSLLKSFVGHLWRINWSIRLVKERLQQRSRHCGGFKCWRLGGFDLSLYLGSDLQYYCEPTTSIKLNLIMQMYICFSKCMYVCKSMVKSGEEHWSFTKGKTTQFLICMYTHTYINTLNVLPFVNK